MKKRNLCKCRIWKLKENEVPKHFEKKIEARKVESLWKNIKKCLLEVSDEVCGRTKGPQRHKESWWWNKEVGRVVEEKSKFYNI